MVLLRSDGTPTYMLAVVVDDHDMGVSHVIRGDDHLNNAFRQRALITALDWHAPVYAHIPLIHGEDGHKLSKRHGAVGLHEFEAMGILPEALENYLVRLGWSHGDAEIISRSQAIEWFNLSAIGQGPAKLDAKKLESVNAHYLRDANPARLISLIAPELETKIGTALSSAQISMLTIALPELAARAKNIHELAQGALCLVRNRPVQLDDAATKAVNDANANLLDAVIAMLNAHADWTPATLEAAFKNTATELGLGLGKFLPVLRAALCGTTQAPAVSHIIVWLGKQESIARLQDQLNLKK
jgi:glutamyl-tRNA synthetase